jgi:hypothetical protein
MQPARKALFRQAHRPPQKTTADKEFHLKARNAQQAAQKSPTQQEGLLQSLLSREDNGSSLERKC